jgi:hypothetical protein
VIRVAALLAVGALALSACQTTQELSAQRAKRAKRLVAVPGLRVGRPNPDVAVGPTAVVHDRNGIAAVVELRNTGRAAQAALPVAVTVTDARGAALYRNDAPGLESSLVSVPVLEPGRRTFWVDDQITAAGRPAGVQVRVGLARGAAPVRVPAFAISGLKVRSDSDGVFAKATIVNRSTVAQQRLTVSCVGRRGGRVVAAGRAIVDRLAPEGAKPTTFTVFFIGDPRGTALRCAAPATVLR